MNPINLSYSNLSNNYVGLKNKPQVPQEPETAQVPKPSMNSTDTVAFKGVINAQAGKEAAKKAVPFFATAGAAILGFLGVSKYKKEEPVAAPKENLHDLMQARHKQMEENLAKLKAKYEAENEAYREGLRNGSIEIPDVEIQPMKDANELHRTKTISPMRTAEELQLKETKAPAPKIIIDAPERSALAALNPYEKIPQINMQSALKNINKYKLPDKAPIERETLTSKIDAATLASRTAEAKAEGEKEVEIPTYLGADGETYHKQIFDFDGQFIGERSFDGKTITEKNIDPQTGLVKKIKTSTQFEKPLSEIYFADNGDVHEKYWEYRDTSSGTDYYSYTLVTERRNSKGEILFQDKERAHWNGDCLKMMKYKFEYDKPYSYDPETQVVKIGNKIMYNPDNEAVKQKYFEKLNNSIENTLRNGNWQYSGYEDYINKDEILCWLNDGHFKGTFRVNTQTNELKDLSVDVIKDNEKYGYISYYGNRSGIPATMAIGKNGSILDESSR